MRKEIRRNRSQPFVMCRYCMGTEAPWNAWRM